jgi:hypothetical protein
MPIHIDQILNDFSGPRVATLHGAKNCWRCSQDAITALRWHGGSCRINEKHSLILGYKPAAFYGFYLLSFRKVESSETGIRIAKPITKLETNK